ncbi:hypothetical protein MN186_07440 [Aliiroseovarius sp. N1F302]|uniref:hypothetical protein n=1 Tax=Aliiroseovarius sediminis TaxID=2925839 RepID=UPI001F590CC3|nr:hypothetical protein [Aliiroseovarius sediminis]MCI2394303.1 hypothetical protein [Aliiroseovarius sediminis]
MPWIGNIAGTASSRSGFCGTTTKIDVILTTFRAPGGDMGFLFVEKTIEAQAVVSADNMRLGCSTGERWGRVPGKHARFVKSVTSEYLTREILNEHHN